MNCCELTSCNADAQIFAVILDLDGTLLDTEKATKNILKDFLGKYGKVLDKEKEDNRLGMMHKESAASIVKDYDLPLTPHQYCMEIMPMYYQRWPQAKALPGANRLIMHLHKNGVPLALASNSITKNIEEKISHQEGWKESFSAILGSDQVHSGKPSPDIFIEAAKRMGVDAGHCLVIEDSLVGVTAAKAAGMKVVAVPSLQTQADRYSMADYVLHSLLEFRPELWGLPAFEDWVKNALPIQPIYVKGQVKKGLLCDVADDGPTALPDQVWGVYFGWAELSTHEIFKVIVSIGWHHHSGSSKRVIKPCLIGEYDKSISNQQIQMLLVGYIRGLSSEESTSMDFEVLEKDKTIASESLDLPTFIHRINNPLIAEAFLVEDNAALDEQE